MTKTHHSEYGIIKSIYLKPVNQAFVNQKLLSEQWKKLNYIGQPSYETALTEYVFFENHLKSTGAEINYFSYDSSVGIDSIYCRDASIATDYGIILCNMGKEARNSEPGASAENYKENHEKILGKIEPPGTVEGGDIAWIDTETLAIGRTYRTNDSGIEQMHSLLKPYGVRLIVVDLPHYKGPSDVFHLMSIFSPIDKDLAVVYPPLMPISFFEFLRNRGFQFVEVPDNEFESMGCNVLATAPRQCLMVKGNPITQTRLIKAGVTLTTYEGKEISLKGGGGPTCLTRPMIREIEN